MDINGITKLLLEHGVRPTANRLAIAASLAEAGRPMSMCELEQQLGSIDKSNIFRALGVFKEARLVRPVEDGSDGVRYELCTGVHGEAEERRHVHFYCESCGRTFCLHEIPVPEVLLPEGWDVWSVNYLVKGVCHACGGAEN